MVKKVIIGRVALTLSSMACALIAVDQGMKRKKECRTFKEEIKRRDTNSKHAKEAYKKIYEQNKILVDELKKYKDIKKD
ncbi:hypothetical protein [Clostridium sp. C8-1-8]|uniref:hypothetical protein n=1 Tax=Clostridium sp. C8-1-8 TaxID=2698831 RepID=UPI00136F41DA|nr:hypothetical protein [Clostridium sp. C8-1-8]